MGHHGNEHHEDKNAGFRFFYPTLLASFVIFIMIFLNSSVVVGGNHGHCECSEGHPCKCESPEACEKTCGAAEEKVAEEPKKEEAPAAEEAPATDSTAVAAADTTKKAE